MTLTEILNRIKDAGLPIAFHEFETDAPPMPYCIYETPSTRPFYADGIVYFAKQHISVTVCAKRKSLLLEAKMAYLFRGLTYRRTETRDDAENRYEYNYTFEVI